MKVVEFRNLLNDVIARNAGEYEFCIDTRIGFILTPDTLLDVDAEGKEVTFMDSEVKPL